MGGGCGGVEDERAERAEGFGGVREEGFGGAGVDSCGCAAECCFVWFQLGCKSVGKEGRYIGVR